MAHTGSRDIGRPLKSTIECPSCKLPYSNPRMLPCVHTYCHPCLSKVVGRKSANDTAACPFCQTEFVIPVGGVEGLPRNLLAEQLKNTAQGSSIHCEGCSADESVEKVLATKFCVSCSQRFCETCVEIHGRIRATRLHKLVNISDDKSLNELSAKLVRSYCHEHGEETLKYYCFDCESPICVTCFLKSHKSHECSDIDEVTDKLRPQINENIDKLVAAAGKCRRIMADIKRETEELKRAISTVESEICQEAERKKQQIEQDKQELLEKIYLCKNDRIKRIDHVTQNVEQHIEFIGSLIDYARELADKGTAGDVTQQTRCVRNRAEELLKLDVIKTEVCDLGFTNLTFKPVPYPTESGGNTVGIFEESTTNGVWVYDNSQEGAEGGEDFDDGAVRDYNYFQETMAERVNTPTELTAKYDYGEAIELSLVRTIPRNQAIDSLTSIDDEIFLMLGPHYRCITVYSASTFKLTRTLTVTGLGLGWCRLTSCATNRCLYVSDWSNNDIKRVDVAAVKGTVTWPVGGNPDGLSVNKKCNVLVVCHEDNTIEEYTPNGDLVVPRITLQQSEVGELFHAIELSNRQYVVSHGKPVNGVSIVNRGGQVVFTHRNGPHSATRLMLDAPRYLAVSVGDCILVADSGNNRVVMFNSTLCRSRVAALYQNGGMHSPWCLNLDESRGRLYIGESKHMKHEKRVLICDLDISSCRL